MCEETEWAGVAKLRKALDLKNEGDGGDDEDQADRDHNQNKLEYGNRWDLLRWWRAWGGKVEEIRPRYRKTLDFRSALDLDAVPGGSDEEFADWMKERFTSPGLDYYPGGIAGFDRLGNVVVVEPLGRADPRGLLSTGRVSEFYRARMTQTERVLRLVKRQEARLGRKLGLLLVIDLFGLSMDQLYLPTMHIYMDLIRMLQDHFPDLLSRLIVIRAPAIFQVAYNMVYPILAKQTRDKLEIAGKDWQQILHNQVDPASLSPEWGGSKTGGVMRLGGKVPETLAYKPSENPLEPINAACNVSTITVPRAATRSFRLGIPISGPVKVSWYFRCTGGDIYFTVSAIEKEKQWPIQPRMRLNTDLVPEFGVWEAANGTLPNGTRPSALLFLWDNGHSRLRSKTIEYYATVES